MLSTFYGSLLERTQIWEFNLVLVAGSDSWTCRRSRCLSFLESTCNSTIGILLVSFFGLDTRGIWTQELVVKMELKKWYYDEKMTNKDDLEILQLFLLYLELSPLKRRTVEKWQQMWHLSLCRISWRLDDNIISFLLWRITNELCHRS